MIRSVGSKPPPSTTIGRRSAIAAMEPRSDRTLPSSVNSMTSVVFMVSLVPSFILTVISSTTRLVVGDACTVRTSMLMFGFLSNIFWLALPTAAAPMMSLSQDLSRTCGANAAVTSIALWLFHALQYSCAQDSIFRATASTESAVPALAVAGAQSTVGFAIKPEPSPALLSTATLVMASLLEAATTVGLGGRMIFVPALTHLKDMGTTATTVALEEFEDDPSATGAEASATELAEAASL
mmetsp:Transcript_104704/g.223824  ORF Transcript_104704/g.223824 Transcript_104704/m.223824 type:complete len:239 (+) Transcript_104704:389-1105(+)